MRALCWLRSLSVAFALAGCSATVPPGSIGVTTSWGRVETWTYPEGFHFISPFTNVYPMSVRTETYQMGESGEATTPHDADVDALTRDQLAVGIGVSVQFHLRDDDAVPVFRLLGPDYATSVIHPIVRTAVRDAAASFAAMELVDQREAFQTRMESLVYDGVVGLLGSRGIDANAIVVDNVLLLNIDLPDTLDEAIADVQRERQATAQREQSLRTASAEAARLRAEAEGQAAALVIAAQAQADANRLVASSLTEQVLHLREIEASRALLESPNDHVMVVPAGQPLTLLASGPSTGR
jgi:regulator of protease activity HflC (stomatin/prohibitin superfamily)